VSVQNAAFAEERKDERPYVIRTYDRWIILILVVVLGWFLFRPLFGFAVYYRGVSFERMFQLTSAEHYYIKSTRIYPKLPQGWQGWGELLMMRAPSDESQRQLALSVLEQGIAYNPTYGPLEFDLGRTYFVGKDYKNAVKAFARSGELMPNDLFSWDYAAWSSLHAGDVRDALKYWRQVLRIDPGNAVAHRQIGLLGG
jgi:tetratricopeptide (TPR) repeat protein